MDDFAWTSAHLPFLVVRDVCLERSFLGHGVFLEVGSRILNGVFVLDMVCFQDFL
jgi:hypothetical protein